MSFNVTKLMFMETGAYHQQTARPYNTYLDDERNILSLRNATQNGSNISSISVAGVASSLIRPASEHGRDINIFQGWGERRYRFFMEIEMMVANVPTRKIIIGYTDHVGVSMGGSLDPNMRMYINNVIVLRLMGMNQWQVFESNHIVADDLLVHGDHRFSNQSVIMRPEDVFNTLQATNCYSSEKVQLLDFRANTAAGLRKSSRGNTNHNQYLAKSLKALHTASANADHAQGTMGGIYQEATAKVRESNIQDDNLLRTWDDQANYFEDGFITYGMLCDMSPSTPYVTQHFEMKPAIKRETQHTDNTQHFRGSDVTSIMSTILSNTVPPLLMECLLTRLKFNVTNATMNGQPFAKVLDVPRGFISDIPLDNYIDLFLDRLCNIVMPDVTNNWNYVVDIIMDVDVLGETRIEIKTSEETYYTTYVIPSFADGLTSPIVGNHNQDLQALASDIDVLNNNIGMTLETESNVQVFGQGNQGGNSHW